MTPGRNSFANICDAMAGIETMIPVVFSEGIRNDHRRRLRRRPGG